LSKAEFEAVKLFVAALNFANARTRMSYNRFCSTTFLPASG